MSVCEVQDKYGLCMVLVAPIQVKLGSSNPLCMACW